MSLRSPHTIHPKDGEQNDDKVGLVTNLVNTIIKEKLRGCSLIVVTVQPCDPAKEQQAKATLA